MPNDYFEYNGVSSKTKGLVILTFPPRTSPTERMSAATIPGRSGSLTTKEGENVFDDITLAFTCMIENPTDAVIRELPVWLSGSGKLKVPMWSDGYYVATPVNQFQFATIVRNNPNVSFNVQFRCKPFFYLNSGDTIHTKSSTTLSLNNLGNMPALPFIEINGSGACHIMCNGKSLDITGFDSEGKMFIDCENKIAYRNGTGSTKILLSSYISRNDNSSEWFSLPVGPCNITTSGSISTLKVTPHWRCK